MKLKTLAAVMLPLCLFSCKNEELEAEYSISLDTGSLDFGSAADEQSIIVSCNGKWTLSTEDDDSWCSVSAYRGSGDVELTFSAEPNMDVEERSILYVFRCEDKTAELTVSQDAHAYSISVGVSRLEFKAEDETLKEITVTSSDKWTLEVEDSWCVPSAVSGHDGDVVSFYVENYSGTEESRSTTATFSCGDKSVEIEVVQGAKVYSISVEPKELTFSAEDESSKEVTVTSSDEWTLEVADDWCIPSLTSGGNGDKVSFTVTGKTLVFRETAAIFHCGNKTAEVAVKQNGMDAVAIEPENFLNALLTAGVDADGNGYISGEELAATTALDIDIKSAGTGQTYKFDMFPSLKDLTVKTHNEKDVIDIADHQKIENIHIMSGDRSLNKIDVSGCHSLKELYCPGYGLTSLDIGGCSALEKLSCYSTDITSLDLSSCTALKELSCSNTDIISLDLSNCAALKYLDCSDTDITSLDLSSCTALEELSCYHADITSLDLSNCCTTLKFLNCTYTQITSIDLSGCSALEALSCNHTQISSLDISDCAALEFLECGDTQISSLDISDCVALGYLDCGNTQISSLDLSNCRTTIVNLYCDNTQITRLDLSDCSALENLYCNNARIASLDVSNCINLGRVDCSDNLLTILDFSTCAVLQSISCSGNPITKTIIGERNMKDLYSWILFKNNNGINIVEPVE